VCGDVDGIEGSNASTIGAVKASSPWRKSAGKGLNA
jgi:hypothetical protein